MSEDSDQKDYNETKKKGIMNKNKGGVTVRYLPTRMENKRISKAEFIAYREKQKRADLAAEAARRKALADEGLSEDTPPDSSEKVSALEKKIEATKGKIIKAKEDLEDDPENAKAKKTLLKLQEQLDVLEDELESI